MSNSLMSAEPSSPALDAGQTASESLLGADALQRVWHAERASLLRLCQRWTRDPVEAEDLLADACLKALEGVTRAGAIANPAAYCMQIISNLARDRLRAGQRRAWMTSAAETSEEADVAGAEASSESRLLAKRRVERTLERLPSLSEAQRQALVSRSQGDDYRAIADRLGTSSANARKLVQSARDILRAPNQRDPATLAAALKDRDCRDTRPRPAPVEAVAPVAHSAKPISSTLPGVGLLKHSNSGRVYQLAARHVIGRAAMCHTRLAELTVSAMHAEISWDGSAWLLRDLGSRNGTFLEGKKLEQGKQVTLRPDVDVIFGDSQNQFRLVDGAAPRLMALSSSDEVVVAENDALCLPSAAAIEAMVYANAAGSWVVETDGKATPVEDQDLVLAGGRKWRVCLPNSAAQTCEPSLGTQELALRFEVSRDEENVSVCCERGKQSFMLEPRAHSYLLLTLARARLKDAQQAGLPEGERGWLSRDELARMLRIDMPQLNLWVFRARQQVSSSGLGVAGRLIERRPGSQELRLGVARVFIDHS